jgi:hypothetical protein
MELALSTINQSRAVACRLAWGLLDLPQSNSEAAPLPAF